MKAQTGRMNFAAMPLIILGCLLATVSVAAIWLHQVVLNTDRYVATVAPLSDDVAVKDAVARFAAAEVVKRTNAESLARMVLPDRADFLAAPAVGAAQGLLEEQIRPQLDTPEFKTVWRDANREAHELVLQVVLGQPGTVHSEDGAIKLRLGGLLEIVRIRLQDMGIHAFDSVSFAGASGDFTVFKLPQIVKAQQSLDLLNRLVILLPILAVALLGAAVWLSRRRLAALIWIGLGLSTGMVALLVALAAGRDYYLDAVSSHPDLDMAVASAFFNIIAGSLKTVLMVVLFGGLLFSAFVFTLQMGRRATTGR